MPALIGEGGRHRNPARVLLNELISKLLEERFIWFSILALAEDPTIAPYFADYDANRPYADLLTFGILREHATSDRTDVIVSFTPKQLFAYALYEYFRSSTDFSIDNIVAIVADLLCYPTTQIVVTDGVTFDEQHEAIRYYKVLYNFWNPPLVEAIAHLLADRVEAGEEEMFVIPFLVHCYGTTGGYYAAEHISIKLIEVIARTKPETLGRLIPTMISVCPMPIVAISEDRILGQLFNDLVGNVLTQEAISIAGALVAEWANRPAEIVGVYLMLARVYQAAHNDEQRRANLLEANRHAIASGDVVKKGQVANAIGVFYNETGGDPATAIEWLEQGLECAIKAGQSQDSIAAAHFNIGVALANQREFVRAVSHLEQSLKLMDVKDTPLFVAKIQAEIGKAQEAQGNFEQAMTAYQLAVSLYGAASMRGCKDVLSIPPAMQYMQYMQCSKKAQYKRSNHLRPRDRILSE